MSSKASSTVDVSLSKRGLDHKNRWKIKVHSFIYGQNIFEYDQFWKFETTTKMKQILGHQFMNEYLKVIHG